MKIIDGKSIAERVEVRIREAMKEKKTSMSLASLFVGEAEDSALYTKRKAEAAERLGVHFSVEQLPDTTPVQAVEEKIRELNERVDLTGYIIQLPLPDHLRVETDRLLNLIVPSRDVDGLTAVNRLHLLRGEEKTFYPTPVYAVLVLLASLFLDITWEEELQFLTNRLPKLISSTLRGESATIISDGDVFGQTLQYLLERAGIRTKVERSDALHLETSLASSKLVMSAVGKPGFFKGTMLRDDAVVIDVGTTLVNGKTKGDLDWDSIQQTNITATPVPGGVGPVTVAMLYANLLNLKLFPPT